MHRSARKLRPGALVIVCLIVLACGQASPATQPPPSATQAPPTVGRQHREALDLEDVRVAGQGAGVPQVDVADDLSADLGDQDVIGRAAREGLGVLGRGRAGRGGRRGGPDRAQWPWRPRRLVRASASR